MLEPARLQFTADGTPWSETYGDIYHSSHGGPAQARHVFLGGNDLPRRWQGRERFIILETGFGLGLNFLATWATWRADPQACGRLHFVSVEKHPFSAGDLARAQAAWPEFAPLAAELQAAWPLLVPGVHRLNLDRGRVVLTLVFGDARHWLRRLDLAADALYLDGFSPARNPELWTPEICKALARLAAPGATLATWAVSGELRRALAAQGFTLARAPGFARKRHMLTGFSHSRKPLRHWPPDQRQALVIGAGVAGTSAAAALAGRGWNVEVLEQEAEAGRGASGNLAGVLRPLPSRDDNLLARLTRAGFLATRRHLLALEAAGLPVRWGSTGALHLGRDASHAAHQARTVTHLGLPPELLQFLDAEAASKRIGWPVPWGGWYFPLGGWVQPPSLCRANLLAYPDRIRFRSNCQVADIRHIAGLWHALDGRGEVLAAAPHLVMASGVATPRFRPFAWLPQKAARGQVSLFPAGSLPPLELLVCGNGYLTPAVDGLLAGGATHQPDDPETAERLTDHVFNLTRINRLLPGFADGIRVEQLRGRVGFRPMSPDRLPIVGPAPDPDLPLHPRHVPRQPGLWCIQGFGARGIVWSALMAELLASRMEGEPLPLENDLVAAVDPGRFLLRRSSPPVPENPEQGSEE